MEQNLIAISFHKSSQANFEEISYIKWVEGGYVYFNRYTQIQTLKRNSWDTWSSINSWLFANTLRFFVVLNMLSTPRNWRGKLTFPLPREREKSSRVFSILRQCFSHFLFPHTSSEIEMFNEPSTEFLKYFYLPNVNTLRR